MNVPTCEAPCGKPAVGMFIYNEAFPGDPVYLCADHFAQAEAEDEDVGDNMYGRLVRLGRRTDITLYGQHGTNDHQVLGYVRDGCGCAHHTCRRRNEEGLVWHAIPYGFAQTLPRGYHYRTIDEAVQALQDVAAAHPETIDEANRMHDRYRQAGG